MSMCLGIGLWGCRGGGAFANVSDWGFTARRLITDTGATTTAPVKWPYETGYGNASTRYDVSDATVDVDGGALTLAGFNKWQSIIINQWQLNEIDRLDNAKANPVNLGAHYNHQRSGAGTGHFPVIALSNVEGYLVNDSGAQTASLAGQAATASGEGSRDDRFWAFEVGSGVGFMGSHRSTTGSLAVPIAFNTIDIDTHSGWSTNEYVIPQDGVYLVYGMFLVDRYANQYDFYIEVDRGSGYTAEVNNQDAYPGTVNDIFSPQGMKLLKLDAGDKIRWGGGGPAGADTAFNTPNPHTIGIVVKMCDHGHPAICVQRDPADTVATSNWVAEPMTDVLFNEGGWSFSGGKAFPPVDGHYFVYHNRMVEDGAGTVTGWSWLWQDDGTSVSADPVAFAPKTVTSGHHRDEHFGSLINLGSAVAHLTADKGLQLIKFGAATEATVESCNYGAVLLKAD